MKIKYKGQVYQRVDNSDALMLVEKVIKALKGLTAETVLLERSAVKKELPESEVREVIGGIQTALIACHKIKQIKSNE